MLKKVIPIVALVILFADCKKNWPLDDNLTNKEKMEQLVIEDPLIWNTLTTQAMELDTTGPGMKADNGMMKEKEYPNKGYYFTLFEDLYPSQGDYDFNDVMLRTKIKLDAKKGEVNGSVNTKYYWDGGSLSTKLGLRFFSVKGNKEYTQIDNNEITLSSEDSDGTITPITLGDNNFTMDVLPLNVNDEFIINFEITDRTNNINQLWIEWYIIVGANETEIHTSGFPSSKNRKFDIPQIDFVSAGNLPWGMEIETEKFYIPVEGEVFLDVFPEFKEWAETGGVKNKKWFENPDMSLVVNPD